MDVRDADEDDAKRIADLADLPATAARELVHDRSVRVAVRGGDVVGVVSFDADPDVVHVTRLVGDPDAMAALLGDPVAFAEREGMAVDAVLAPGDPAAPVLRDAGFEAVGAGPRFEGRETRRFRLEP